MCENSFVTVCLGYKPRIRILPCGVTTFLIWLGEFVPERSWVGKWFMVEPSKQYYTVFHGPLMENSGPQLWGDLFGKKREGTNVLLGSSGTCLIIVQLTPPSCQSTKLPLPGSHTSQLFMLLLMRTCLPSCLQSEKFMALQSVSFNGGVVEIGTSV